MFSCYHFECVRNPTLVCPASPALALVCLAPVRPSDAQSCLSPLSPYPLSPIFRTHFQVPYTVSSLLATLTKNCGGIPNNSHFGIALLRTRLGLREWLLRDDPGWSVNCRSEERRCSRTTAREKETRLE